MNVYLSGAKLSMPRIHHNCRLVVKPNVCTSTFLFPATNMSELEEKQSMEIDEAEVLDSSSVDGAPSCSSSILDNPVGDDDGYEDDDDFVDGINVTILSSTANTSCATTVARTETDGSAGKQPMVSGDQQRTKLSGAARKRYKKLLADGIDSEAAYALSRVPPQTPNTEKRSRDTDLSGSTSGGENPRKKQNLCPPKEPELGSNRPLVGKFSVQNRLQINSNVCPGRNETPQSNNKALYSDVVNYVRVGIIPKDYPNVELTTPQLLSLRKAILTKVAQQRKEKIKPKFGQCLLRTGHLLLVCKNQETADWLKSIASTLSAPGEVELTVLDEKKIPRPEIIIGFFPVSIEDSTSDILELLESQNEGLNTDEWRIKERNIINQLHVELIFTVDGASLDTIKKCGFLLDYKFGTAPLRRKITQKNKTSNQGANDLDGPSDNQNYHSIPDEQQTALIKGVNRQTTNPTKHLKTTGDIGSTLNLDVQCLPGPSGIRDANNNGVRPKKIPEGTRSGLGRKSALQQSPGSKGALESKRNVKNIPSDHQKMKTDPINNKNPIHKNKYITKYIQSLGDRETNTECAKTPQESDTIMNQ